jgi:hypothetical protein
LAKVALLNGTQEAILRHHTVCNLYYLPQQQWQQRMQQKMLAGAAKHPAQFCIDCQDQDRLAKHLVANCHFWQHLCSCSTPAALHAAAASHKKIAAEIRFSCQTSSQAESMAARPLGVAPPKKHVQIEH